MAHLPLGLLYGIAGVLGWLSVHVYPHREHVVRENLTRAFPAYDEPALRRVIRAYYLGFAQVLVEVVKAVRMRPEEFQRRVRITNLAAVRALLDQGQSVLLVAAHQCNWEWMLLALSLELGHPLDAAYKPLVDSWAEREMKKLRTRFGSRLVPAKDLLADIIKRRDVVRAVAMVADQEPTTSEHKHWTRFLNRDTAFYMGPEEISRVTRFPVFFLGLKRTAPRLLRRVPHRAGRRGRAAPERRRDRALRAPGRGPDPRLPARLAVVAQALEAEEVAVPGARAAPRRRRSAEKDRPARFRVRAGRGKSVRDRGSGCPAPGACPSCLARPGVPESAPVSGRDAVHGLARSGEK